MSVPSLELQTRIAELREKARHGTLTQDECREGIRFLRQERLAMPAKTTKSKTIINGDDLLSELS